MRYGTWSVWALVASSLGGCYNNVQAATRRAERDTGCAAVVVRELDSDRYQTRGCGEVRNYQCFEESCWAEGYRAKVAVRRASREFDCAKRELRVRWVQEEVYSVAGCGQRATYECDSEHCYPEGPKTEVNPGTVLGVIVYP